MPPPLSTGEEGAVMKRAADDEGGMEEEGGGAQTSESVADPRRVMVEQRIAAFFHQLNQGCGTKGCSNGDCRSNGVLPELTPNQAALRAVQCVKQGHFLCSETHSSSSRSHSSPSSSSSSSTNDETGGNKGLAAKPASKLPKPSPPPEESASSPGLPPAPSACPVPCRSSSPSRDPPPIATSSSTSSTSSSFANPPPPRELVYLTESFMRTLVEECLGSGDFTPLIRRLGRVFCSSDATNKSFLKEEAYQKLLSPNPPPTSGVGEGTPENHLKNGTCNLDIESARRAFEILRKVPEDVYLSPLTSILVLLFDAVELELKFRNVLDQDPHFLNLFIIVLDLPLMIKEEFASTVLPALCKAAAQLPLQGQAGLARIWSRLEPSRLRSYVQTIQSFITQRVISRQSRQYDTRFAVNDDDSIVSPTCLLKILYYAVLHASPRDAPVTLPPPSEAIPSSTCAPSVPPEDPFMGELFGPDTDPVSSSSSQMPGTSGGGRDGGSSNPVDPLAMELGVQAIDIREPVVPFGDFYNEPLSDAVEMDKDYSYFREDHHRFSFMNNAFILTPVTKSFGLFFDSRIRMHTVRRMNLIQSAFSGTVSQPYLRVTVRREFLIEDALSELEVVSMQNPNDLRKQLVVEFVNEQGVDEGGVSKEFFQLIVESIFNPDYAMFITDPETRIAWFNPTSFETDRQYTLIGIVFGLAIYNNVILNVNFPRVVYKKLMGRRGTFHDLQDYNPTLYRSLGELLEYSGSETVEDVFMLNFRVGYRDIFDNPLSHDLLENGEDVVVTEENRLEFVERYADFILNVCIERQFRAFKRGFTMVAGDSPLSLLFRPDEVELLVCGSKDYNFDALEEGAEYDQGYCAQSETVRHFWSVIHTDLDDAAKRKLLQFTTGSDRVPVGGMSQLRLIIARHGPDSDRLPTAHTCFNVLLLPDYQNREKLKERLLKAISYSQGFGML